MSDQCRNCTIRGDIKKCLETDCFQHEDWWAQTVLAQLSEAQGEISKLHTSIEEYEIENDKWRNYYNNFKQENAALRAELAEKEREVEVALDKIKELEKEIKRRNSKTWCAYCGFEIDIDDEASTKISEHIMSCPDHPIRLYERHSEALEAENAELRERLKPVEKVCKKWDKKGDRELLHRPRLLAQELWQAIEAACEKGK